eukprot:COSAG06_NODE_14837_length_1121_cov_6.471624_2_plen_60_part_01
MLCLLLYRAAAVSKGDAAGCAALLCPPDPLAPSVPVNDNELLAKGFKVRAKSTTPPPPPP